VKILVLGASGQVGSELGVQLDNVLSLTGQNYSLVLASRSEVDVSDLPALSYFLKLNSSDWIVNATAYTAVDKAEKEVSQAYRVNEDAVGVMAEHCASSNSKLIHISTDYVFDGSGDLPVFENNKLAPLGVYGASKLAGEKAIRATLTQHLILRTAWVFGASGGNFVKTMLRLAETRSELGVVSDQHGAPTSARGIAMAIATMVLQMSEADSDDERWGTYHYTGHPFVSWADFAREIFRQSNQRSMIPKTPIVNSIATEQYPTLAKRPHNSRLDCSKIKKVFGIEPDNWQVSLGEMLDGIRRESVT
jgi:dTDP-4-dehydrorhamnose reductase